MHTQVGNNYNFAILIRKVSEYKQHNLQTYKNEIYNLSNTSYQFISRLNLNLPFLESRSNTQQNKQGFKNTFNSLKKQLSYEIYFETWFKNCSIFKVVHGLKTVESLKNNSSFKPWAHNFLNTLFKDKALSREKRTFNLNAISKSL